MLTKNINRSIAWSYINYIVVNPSNLALNNISQQIV